MKRILLVEDNPLNRELIREFLDAWGFEVIEAVDGLAAIVELRRCNPDLVLMDIQLPKQDGYQTLAILRRDNRFRSLPVIALTAFAMKGDEERALDAGFNAYHSKPVDSKKLRGQIEQLLNNDTVRD